MFETIGPKIIKWKVFTQWELVSGSKNNNTERIQGNYATVGSAIVAIAIVGRGGWAGLSSTVAI